MKISRKELIRMAVITVKNLSKSFKVKTKEEIWK